HRFRAEIVDRLELELDGELAALVADLVRNAIHGARRHAFHHLVEVVQVDVDELAVLHLRQRLLGLAAEVAHDADDEGQFLLFDGVALLDVVGQLDARRAHLLQALLDTILLGHLIRLLTIGLAKRPLLQLPPMFLNGSELGAGSLGAAAAGAFGSGARGAATRLRTRRGFSTCFGSSAARIPSPIVALSVSASASASRRAVSDDSAPRPCRRLSEVLAIRKPPTVRIPSATRSSGSRWRTSSAAMIACA